MAVIINKEVACKRLNYALEESGITTEDLSLKLGVCQCTVEKWKNGKETPAIEQLVEIADNTMIPLEFFIPVIRGVTRDNECNNCMCRKEQ